MQSRGSGRGPRDPKIRPGRGRRNRPAPSRGGHPSRGGVTVGGGTRGGLWTRIVSDVTGLPQDVPADTTGAALGDAFLAAAAVGAADDVHAWNPVVDTVAPDPGAHALHDGFHQHYRGLYAATADTAHFLADQQRRADRGH